MPDAFIVPQGTSKNKPDMRAFPLFGGIFYDLTAFLSDVATHNLPWANPA
jgi:hypothetical protein